MPPRDRSPAHEIAVLPAPSPEGERFVIVEIAAFLADFTQAFLSTSTTAERLAAIAGHVHGRPVLDAAGVRVRLEERGLSGAAIDESLERARRMTALLTAGGVSFERITRVGFTNVDGQEVVRRTDRFGAGGQRVFVLRCDVCGHEYGTYGCDTDIRRCPECQDGPPGLPVTV